MGCMELLFRMLLPTLFRPPFGESLRVLGMYELSSNIYLCFTYEIIYQCTALPSYGRRAKNRYDPDLPKLHLTSKQGGKSVLASTV